MYDAESFFVCFVLTYLSRLQKRGLHGRQQYIILLLWAFSPLCCEIKNHQMIYYSVGHLRELHLSNRNLLDSYQFFSNKNPREVWLNFVALQRSSYGFAIGKLFAYIFFSFFESQRNITLISNSRRAMTFWFSAWFLLSSWFSKIYCLTVHSLNW